jgi:hypothetical protein
MAGSQAAGGQIALRPRQIPQGSAAQQSIEEEQLKAAIIASLGDAGTSCGAVCFYGLPSYSAEPMSTTHV